MLDVKKTLAKLLKRERTTFAPQSGSAYTNYGGCFYETFGGFVHVHLGIQGLRNNAVNTIFTLPQGLRPQQTVAMAGTAGGINTFCDCQIDSAGQITAIPNGTYCGADLFFIVGGVVSRLLNALTSKRRWAVC